VCVCVRKYAFNNVEPGRKKFMLCKLPAVEGYFNFDRKNGPGLWSFRL